MIQPVRVNKLADNDLRWEVQSTGTLEAVFDHLQERRPLWGLLAWWPQIKSDGYLQPGTLYNELHTSVDIKHSVQGRPVKSSLNRNFPLQRLGVIPLSTAKYVQKIDRLRSTSFIYFFKISNVFSSDWKKSILLHLKSLSRFFSWFFKLKLKNQSCWRLFSKIPGMYSPRVLDDWSRFVFDFEAHTCWCKITCNFW